MTSTELLTFLTEKLSEYDPELVLDDGSALYAKVVQPLAKRLGTDPMSVDIEEFIAARMAEEFPNIDVTSPGSVVKDMLVNPLVLILEPLRREIEFLKTQKSLADADALTDDELDALLANVFSAKYYGERALTTVRVSFDSPRTVTIDKSITFSTSSGLVFEPQEVTRTYYYYEMTKAGTQYYIDIPVQSVTATSDANVKIGDIKYSSGLNGVVNVTNRTHASGGRTAESNTDAVTRASRLLTERSLNTKRGIETAVRANFPDVISVSVVGFGEPTMERDVVTASVELPTEELAGNLLFTSSNWKTLSILTSGTIDFPVTNKLYVKSTNGNWDDATVEKFESATFIRVVDGSHTQWPTTGATKSSEIFTTALLGRLRTIASVTVGDDDVTIVLDDFELFSNDGAAVAVSTDEPESGFNARSKQGSFRKLIATEDGVDYVIGAPLPVDDHIYTSFDPTDVPGEVYVGRDFLLTATTSTFNPDMSSYVQPNTCRCYPLVKFHSHLDLGIGRVDSYLNNKQSASFVDGAYAYSTANSKMLKSAGLSVTSFGAPNYSSDGDDRYDGVTTPPYGVRAGVNLVVKEDWPSTDTPSVPYAGLDSRPYQCDLILESSGNTWAQLGVKVGDYVACAAVDDTFDGEVDTFKSNLLWYGFGVVVVVGSSDAYSLRVKGLDWQTLATGTLLDYDPTANEYTFPSDTPFRLSWVIYEGARETVNADGKVAVSYTDLAFAPAVKTGAYDSSVLGHSRFVRTCWTTPSEEGSHAYGAGNARVAAWLRLKAAITDFSTSLGAAPAELFRGGEIVDVRVDGVPELYAAERYTATTVGIDIDNDGNDEDIIFQETVLPIQEGAIQQRFEDGDVTFVNGTDEIDQASVSNAKGLGGFLLPHPMGALNYDVAPWDEGGSSISGDDLLKNQVVQLYASASRTATDPRITISGVPGSIPLAEQFGAQDIINNNELHIGGMTDIYILGSMSSVVTPNITVTPYVDKEENIPSKPLEYPVMPDSVVLTTDDGEIDATVDATLFDSADLYNYISANEEAATSINCSRYVVELIDPPEGLTPSVFRLLNTVGNSVRIDGEFPVDAEFSGLSFRLYKDCCVVDTTNVPVLYWQGNDLRTVADSNVVTSDAGFAFELDTNLIAAYLIVDSPTNSGEYRITGKSLYSLTLASTLDETAEDLTFRIVSKQAGGIVAPIARITKVEVADSGAVIPYGLPVDCVVTDVTAINNDPLTNDDISGETAIITEDGGVAVLYIDADVDLIKDFKLAPYVSVRIDDFVDPDRHWYVTDIVSAGGRTTLNGLKLDRALSNYTADVEGVSFTVGYPAVCNAKVYFKDRTLARAYADTVFAYNDSLGSTYKFRPSPAESACVYMSKTDVVPCVLSSDGATLTFPQDSGTPFSTLSAVGGALWVKTRVLFSGIFAAEEELAIAGKSLVVKINGVKRSVNFSNGSKLLQDAAYDINKALGAYMYAYVSTSGGDSTLKIACRDELEITLDGSFGIVDTLKFDKTKLHNLVYLTGDVVGVGTITDMEDVGDGSYTATVTGLTGLGTALEVLIDIYRAGEQLVMPAEMTDEGNGLFSSVFVVSSFDPNVDGGLVVSGAQLDVADLDMLGYKVYAENYKYSFSTEERLFVSFSSTYLDQTASSFETVYTPIGSEVLITYERCAAVADVQNFALSPNSRVVNNNPLVRQFFPAYPVFSLAFSGNYTTAYVKELVSKYIETLYPNKTFSVFELLARLGRVGVTHVELPQEVSFLLYDYDRKIRMARGKDTIVLDNRYHLMVDLSGVQVTKR